MNTSKTEEREFDQSGNYLMALDKPVQNLGFMFDGERKYIRTSSISRYRRKARKAIKLAKATMIKHNRSRVAKGLLKEKLFKKKLYRNYFHTCKMNFIRYGLKAFSIMNSNEIRKQIKKLTKFLEEETNN